MQLLAANLTTMLAAVAVALAPLLGSPCQCNAAGGASCCSQSAGPSCCSTKGGQASTTSCCCTPEAPEDDAVRCSCSAHEHEVPATTLASSARVVDAEGGAFIFPAIAATADLGLRGASWATAFDLESLGGPPGLRLHALLCVWRN